MKEKLYEICAEILESEEETKKFLSYETLDELYEYFRGKLPELTKDEFDEFICEALDSYAEEQENISKLSSENLESVSGGAFNLRTKIASGALALMSMFPAAGAANVNRYGAGVGSSQSISKVEMVKTKISDAFKKTKEWVKAHPKLSAGIGIGAATLTGLAIALKVRSSKKANKSADEQVSPTLGAATIETERKKFEKDEAKKIAEEEERAILDAGKGYNDTLEEMAKKEEAKKKAELFWDCVKGENWSGALDFLTSKENKDVYIDVDRSIDTKGRTLLIYAACLGETNFVNALLEKGAEINHSDINGKTALMHAAERGKKEIVDVLLKKGADINVVDGAGKTALIYAVTKGQEKIVDALLKHKGIDVTNYDETGRAYIIRNLIENELSAAKKKAEEAEAKKKAEEAEAKRKADPNENAQELMRYMGEGEWEEATDFLKKTDDINVNLKDDNNCTLLIYAAMKNRKDVVNALLGKGANINDDDGHGRTALIYAASFGHKNVVDALLKHKDIDVNFQDKEGKTALMYAVEGGKNEIVDALLKHEGIDVNLQDNEGKSADQYLNIDIQGHKGVEISKLLINAKNEEAKKNVTQKSETGGNKVEDNVLNTFGKNNNTRLSVPKRTKGPAKKHKRTTVKHKNPNPSEANNNDSKFLTELKKKVQEFTDKKQTPKN